MKGIVVYDTSYGNTREVAEVISEALQEAGLEAGASYVKDVKKPAPGECGFLVLGSPTRFGTMSFTVKGFLGKFNGEWEGKPFAAFDTENPENIEQKQGSAAEKIAEKLREKHMRQLLPVHKAVVLQVKDSVKCTLKDGELDRARDYARQIAAELKKVETSNTPAPPPPSPPPAASGSRPVLPRSL